MATEGKRPHPNDTNADWLTPRQAVKILDDAFDQRSAISQQSLLECLRGRQIDAMSFKTLVSREGADDHLIEFYKIPPEDWDHVRWNDSFFGHGILTYRRWDRARRIEEVRHFNVKFNPEHVKRVAAPYQAAQATLAAPPMEENKGPAISPAHLKAWFEFYKKIDGEMREDPAWDHARMCFPKNSITRQKIRDLLPDRPMGRPPKRET